MEFKINFNLYDVTIKELKKCDPSYFASRSVILYDDVVHSSGILDLIINNLHVFQLSDEGFKKLRKEKNLGFSSKSSKMGFNGVNLFAWFHDLNQIACKLLDGNSEVNIELHEHILDFEIKKDGENISITFNKYLEDENTHYVSPYLIHNIKNQKINFYIFIKETIKSSNKFIKTLLEINPNIKNNPEFQSLVDLKNNLKYKWKGIHNR